MLKLVEPLWGRDDPQEQVAKIMNVPPDSVLLDVLNDVHIMCSIDRADMAGAMYGAFGQEAAELLLERMS